MTAAARRLFSYKSNLDPYKILNIPRNATPKDIKAAYFKQAKLHHPDSRSKHSSGNDETFMQIRRAYEMLLNKRETGSNREERPNAQYSSRPNQQYADPSFYKGTVSRVPLYMSNGKMAGLILFATTIGGIFLSAFYADKRDKLKQKIQDSSIQSKMQYDAVIEKSKKSVFEAEIRKLGKRQ